MVTPGEHKIQAAQCFLVQKHILSFKNRKFMPKYRKKIGKLLAFQ